VNKFEKIHLEFIKEKHGKEALESKREFLVQQKMAIEEQIALVDLKLEEIKSLQPNKIKKQTQ
jgi:hypothetical protein